MFPYHYGSYATGKEKDEVYKAIQFPYHYGSYATEALHCGMKKDRFPFPYHYGSYATAFITKILYRFWAGGIK